MGNSSYKGVKERTLKKRDDIFQKELNSVNEMKNKLKLNEKDIIEISNLTCQEAVKKLNDGSINSKKLLTVLALRTSSIGRQYCLITESMFGPALKMAEFCDQNRKGKKNWTFNDGQYDEKKFLPPLYGIPISVKDTFDMEGYSSSLGLLSRAEKTFTDSPLIVAFKNSGMIPFVRSNMPQIGMSPESMNDIWGRSLNPWNKERTVGGSSGGQAGLISSKCSMIGTGSDIGGSLRIPAQFCGVFGLKSTAKRYSANYHTKFSDGFSGSAMIIPLCLGPIARCTQDLALWTKVSSHVGFYDRPDPYIKHIQFDEKSYLEASKPNKKLRVGVIRRLTDIEPTLASSRALEQVIKIMQKDGHQIIDLTIPNQRQVIKAFFRENLGTGCISYREMLDGEPPAKQYHSLFQVGEMWSGTRSAASCISSKIMPRIHYYTLDKSQIMSGYDYQNHAGRIGDYRKNWGNYWFDQKIDIALCIGFGSQAFLHRNSEFTSLAASYTFIWNVLEMTVGSLPVTTVRENEQQYQSQFNDLCTENLKKNALNSQGLPVGIQVIGLPFEEEKVLGTMKYIQQKINFYKKTPLPVL